MAPFHVHLMLRPSPYLGMQFLWQQEKRASHRTKPHLKEAECIILSQKSSRKLRQIHNPPQIILLIINTYFLPVYAQNTPILR